MASPWNTTDDVDQQLQDFYAAHPDHEAHVKVVTGEDFKACYCEIKPLLNLDSLSGYLLKYGIASGYADMEALTSPYFKLQDRLNSFVRLVEEAGDRGFKLLYVCLVESADDAVGHVDVLRKLNNAAEQRLKREENDKASINPPDLDRSPINFSSLSERFREMGILLLEELQQNGVKVTDIRNYISVLPQPLLQECYRSTEESFDQLEMRQTLTGLFHFLNAKVWNFIDYHLLEYVISKFGSQRLKQCMEQYAADLKEYKNHATVHEFMQFWPTRQKPPNYDDITVKLDKDPKLYTMRELDEFRQSLSVEFWPRLSDYAKFVMYHYSQAEGCFEVTWILPPGLVSEFKAVAKSPKGQAFFVQNQVLSVVIRVSEPEGGSEPTDLEVYAVRTPHGSECSEDECDPPRKSCAQTSTTVKEFLKHNPTVQFINQEIFHWSYAQVKPKLDLSVLVGYLAMYELITTEDMNVLNSPSQEEQFKHITLLRMVEEVGPDGYMLLYMCLFESCGEASGHESAVRVLDVCAQERVNKELQRRTSVAVSICESELGSVASDDVSSIFSNPDPPVCDLIEDLSKQFYELSSSTREALAVSDIDLKTIKSHLLDLPRGIQQATSRCVPNHAQDSERSKILLQLFAYLDEKVWNFIDYAILQRMISELLRNGPLQREMERYASRLSQFEKQLTISQLTHYWRGRAQMPHSFKKLSVKINEGPDKCTLESVNRIRKEIRRQFLPPDSDFALLLYKFKRGRGDIVVKFCVAKELVAALVNGVNKAENVSFFVEHGVDLLSVGKLIVYRCNAEQSSNSTEHTVNVIFEHGYKHMDSNGQYPDVAVNNKGWAVQVYHRETALNLRLRYKIGHLHGSTLTWSNHHGLYNKGYFPRVDINDEGMVVTVYASQVGRQLFYRVGWLDVESDSVASLDGSRSSVSTPREGSMDREGKPPDEDTINGATIKWEEEVLIGRGRNPAVSLANNNAVVVAYEKGPLHNLKTYYKIGDIREKAIEWRSEEDKLLLSSGSSKHVSLAVNDREQVVVGYASGVIRSVHYAAGRVSGDSILLGEKHRFTPAGVNYQPVVSINSHGHVVVVHHCLQGRLYLKISCGTWTTDERTQDPKVDWPPENPTANFAFDGYHASVSVNDRLEVLTAYKSLTSQLNKSVRNKVGRLTNS